MLRVMSQSLALDPFLALLWTVAVSRGDCALHGCLCFVSDGVTILPYVCVSTISMLCSGKCPHEAVLTGLFFTSFRLIIGAIRVSKILGKLCGITLVIKKLSLHITLHGFLKHMCACSWAHSQNFSLHFSFLVLPVYFAHSQTSSLTGEVALIIVSQQLRSELAELKKKTKIPKFFDMGL